MTAKQRIEHGAEFPFDAPDSFWEVADSQPPPAKDDAYRAARGVLADLQDRGGIKYGFEGIDEETRIEIVESLASIIRQAMIQGLA